MTGRDPADVIRENAQHFIEGVGVLIPGADTKHSDDCPGCRIDAALEDMQQRDAEKRAAGEAFGRLVAESEARAVAAEAALADTRERAQRLYESYCETVAALADANQQLAEKRAAGEAFGRLLKESEDACAAERQRADDYADTLRDVERNATAWHGPELDNGHARALKVIAGWCRAALDRHTTPAPTDQPPKHPFISDEPLNEAQMDRAARRSEQEGWKDIDP
jgi:hypothetical protein